MRENLLILCCFFLHGGLLFGAEKPNIIFILADDLGYGDLGFNGQKIIRTPRLDQMRREGMLFTQHYSGSTVCAPTRSVLMTGQHTGHTTIRGNDGPALMEDDVTVAEVLKQAGYATGCIGKWGLGGPETTGGANKKGFDFFYGFIDQGRAHHYYQDYLWRNDRKDYFPDNPVKRTHYSHDLLTREAVSFIKRSGPGPFFLYLPYTIPHADADVPEDSLAPYLGKLGPETPFRDVATSKSDLANGYIPCEAPRATFAGMVSRLDRDVGRLLDLLRELQIERNTLVLFTSDNGPTEHGGADPEYFDGNGIFRGIKRDLYEGGIRMPFVAWWPGTIAENSTSHHISAHWDLLPTCAELAGASIPEDIDGISYLPTLLGKDQKQIHPYLYWEFFERGGKQAIRKENWKGVRLNVGRARRGPLELYDLDEDPGEAHDLAGRHPEIASKLSALMESARTDSTHYTFENTRNSKRPAGIRKP